MDRFNWGVELFFRVTVDLARHCGGGAEWVGSSG